MRIGIDVDGTLNNFLDLQFKMTKDFFRQNQLNYKIKYKKIYEYFENLPWSKEENDRYIRALVQNIATTTKIKPKAKEVLRYFKSKGHQIYIITARGPSHFEDAKKTTKTWLEAYHVPYDKIIIDAKDKGLVCKENKIEIFIDDYRKNIENVKKIGTTKCIVFKNRENRNIEDVHYARNWEQIRKLVDKLEQNK